MPFSGRWFYGDSVFIIDIWLWLTLGMGVWWGYRRGDARIARASLGVAMVYILGMVISAGIARSIVADAWRTARGGEPTALMVGPVPITPFRRAVIVDAGEHYVTGTFTFPRRVEFDPRTIPKLADHPAVLQAKATDARIQAVLIWARFPYFEVERVGDQSVVRLRDVRFESRVGSVAAAVSATD